MPTLYQIDKVNSRHLFSFLGIYQDDKIGQYSGMTNAEIRLENARRLASDCGGLTSFAKRMEMSSSQVSQIIGENPSKNIGKNIARRIEAAFNKESGWLDRLHIGPTAEAAAAAAELFEKVAEDYLRAEDVLDLITLFRRSTPKGREFIIKAAGSAEKIAGAATKSAGD